MAKFGYYGVFGFNGGGVYTEWPCVVKARCYIPGVKTKKFRSRREAVNYIVDGLVNEYHVCGEDQIHVEMLEKHTNYYLREGELIDYNKA